MKKTLLELFQMYGAYLQQKGRDQADAYLRSQGCDSATAAGISASFNDAGKLVKADGSRVALTDLMGMRSFI